MSGCPNAWGTMLGMEIKGINYESHRVDSKKLDEEKSSFHPLDPRSKVPVLQDGDTTVYESIAILFYLEMKHSKVPLFGISPKQITIIWQRLFEIVNNLRDPLAAGVTRPIFKGQMVEIEQDAVDKMHEVLQWVDRMLLDTPYLAGEIISVTDVVYMPYIQNLLRAAGLVDANRLNLMILPLDNTYPNISMWLKRIESEPGYDKTYPPHWKVIV